MSLPTSPLFEPVTADDMEALKTASPGFWPAGAALLGLREIERIQRERAESEKWNAQPGANERRYNLCCAAEALRVCAAITYFETNGTPITTTPCNHTH